jgi:hypothetical protein
MNTPDTTRAPLREACDSWKGLCEQKVYWDQLPSLTMGTFSMRDRMHMRPNMCGIKSLLTIGWEDFSLKTSFKSEGSGV